MIVKEKIYNENGDEFIKTYSDKNLKIRKVNTDEVYCTAIDCSESNFNYEETEELIDNEDNALSNEEII